MFQPWKTEYTIPFIAVTCLTVGYIITFFLSQSVVVRNYLNHKYREVNAGLWWFLFQKMTGFVFLGLIPLLIFIVILGVHPYDYGLSFKNFAGSLLWIGILSVIIVIINFIAARHPDNLKTYPQIRIKQWSGSLFLLSAVGWMVYLFGYELMFRGLLLFSCLPVFGYWPSIAVNVSFYSLVHIPKGLRESLSSLLLGFVLCVLTIWTGSIWIAFFTHCVLAITNDIFSIYFNPDMQLKRNRIIT